MANEDPWVKNATNIQKHLKHCFKDSKFVIPYGRTDLLRDLLTFSLFADTKSIYTEEENETLKAMAGRIMNNNDEIHEDVEVFLVYKYTKIAFLEGSQGLLLPFIKFKKQSENHFHFIDYTNHFFNKWNEVKPYYESRQNAFCLPSNGDYNNDRNCIVVAGNYYKDKYPGFNLEIVYLYNLEVSKEELLKKLTTIFKDIKKHSDVKKTRQIVKRLFSQWNIDHTSVKSLVKCLKTGQKINNNVIDALLDGFKNVSGETREYLGTAYFMKDIHPILLLILHPELKIVSGLLKLPNGLKIHPKALIQLTEKEIRLISGSKYANYHECKKILQENMLILDKSVKETERDICQNLGVNALNDFEINGVSLLDQLKPFEIERLSKVIKNTCNSDDKFIKIGVEFSKHLKIINFNQFCAVLEYTAILMKKKTDKIKNDEQQNNMQPSSEIVLGNLAYETIMQNIDVYCRKLQTLSLHYEICSRDKRFKFSDPMIAAYHFKKHKQKKQILNTYLEIANEILSRNDIGFTWTQDGNTKRYETFDNTHKATAVRNNDTIATLGFTDMRRKKPTVLRYKVSYVFDL